MCMFVTLEWNSGEGLKGCLAFGLPETRERAKRIDFRRCFMSYTKIL